MPNECTKRNLTDADVEILVQRIKPMHTQCALNLTVEEGVLLKRFIRQLDTVSTVAGRAIVLTTVVALLTILTKGFWATVTDTVIKR